MVRKSVKKEPVAQNIVSSPALKATYRRRSDQINFPSSTDTIVDEDVVMHEELSSLNAPDLEVNGDVRYQNRDVDRPVSIDTVGPDPSGGVEILGRGVRELVQAIQDLRHIGIEDLVLPLPKIVVVGDQSTGKSSLIEGISGIKVPRKHGVCTRCPLDINLAESVNSADIWSCHVSLIKKYVYEGGRASTSRGRNNEGATRARPLGPWTLQDAEDTPFASTTDKNEVVNLLEWAQTATLNPGRAYDCYVPSSINFKEDRTYQVKFSPNVVRLDIRGPHLPNLSFYDLPGVINVSDVADEEYLVNLVKNLVKDYIGDQECINLLTLPMTDDPANSSASRLIRDMKAEARTVGVLTKPDRVQKAESLEQWMQILNGERFKLGHGYHIVMNNPDVTVDHATARVEEREFFQSNQPWATELKTYDHRFGTLQLQTALSTKLTAQIRRSLPRITQQILGRLQQVNEKLQLLPEPPAGNLPRQIYEKLFLFELEMRKQFDGGDPKYLFRKDWNDLVLKFRKVMADSKPLLIQVESTDSAPTRSSVDTPTPVHRNLHNPIMIDSDDDEKDTRYTTPLPDRTASSKRRIKQSSPPSQPSASKRPRMNDIPQFKSEEMSWKDSYSRRFNLGEVRQILQEAHVGLPGQTNPKAIDQMIGSSIEVWKEPLDHFLNATIVLCQSMIATVINKVFPLWQGTQLYTYAQEVCKLFIEDFKGTLRNTVHKILEWEVFKPTTYNESLMRMMCDSALTSLKNGRREHRARKFLADQDGLKENQRTPSRLTFIEKVAKVTDDQLGLDQYAQEVEAMGNVRGYYECAYSRFVDVVSQAISCELFSACLDQLGLTVKEKLGLVDEQRDEHQRCAILLATDPERERERLRLRKEEETLRQAKARIEGLIEQPQDEDEDEEMQVAI